jgi:hypothetical protein
MSYSWIARLQFPVGERDFSLLHTVQRSSGESNKGVKLTTSLHPVLRPRMVELIFRAQCFIA